MITPKYAITSNPMPGYDDRSWKVYNIFNDEVVYNCASLMLAKVACREWNSTQAIVR